MTQRLRALTAALAVVLALGGLAACGGGEEKSDAFSGELVGLLQLDPGTFENGTLSGTWFRMITIGGGFMVNADSPADGGQATLLEPGRSGGLRFGGYQTQPKPAFDAKGNSLARGITEPTGFFGVAFSIGTNPVDPQTKASVAPPTVTVKDGKVTADLSSWGVTWNNQVFNQGAPKPVPNDGAKAPGQEKAEKVWDWVAGKYLESAPAATTTGDPATGTYDEKTGRLVLEWTSLIEGGPFGGFTGKWHLEGTFKPDAKAPDGKS